MLFRSKSTKHFTLQRWLPEELPLRFYIPEPPSEFKAPASIKYRQLVQNALNEWKQHAPAFGFQVVDKPELAQVVIEWKEHFPENEGAWGLAFYPAPYLTADGKMRHRSVIYLAVFAQPGTGYSGLKAPFEPDQLQAIATHEIGHALGLPHSNNANDMMAAYSYRLTPSFQFKISPRDVATLRRLYRLPRELKANPCGGK